MWPPTPVSVLPRNLLEMQILGPHQELLTQARRGERGSHDLCFNKPPTCCPRQLRCVDLTEETPNPTLGLKQDPSTL